MTAMPDEVRSHRLVLHRWQPSTIDQVMHAIEVSQPELARFMPWADPMPSRASELSALELGHEAFDAGERFDYSSFESDTGELVGGGSVHVDPRTEQWAIGYWTRSDRAGRGYATEVAAALTTTAFAHLEIDLVEIHMDKANVASAAVPPKLGYRLTDDTEERLVLASGHTGSGFVWVMTRSAWR